MSETPWSKAVQVVSAHGRRAWLARCRHGVAGRGSPVSSSVLSSDRIRGQPLVMFGSTMLSGSKPSWVTVSLTVSPIGSRSKVTFVRGSLAALARNSALNPVALAHSGV
jgi:hypothetical protein